MKQLWRNIVIKLWGTIILLVAFVLSLLGVFLLPYIDMEFTSNSYEIKRLFVIICIIGFSLTTFFAFFLSSKITQPLLQLKRAADMITMGHYDTKVGIRSSDEIGQLAVAFNHMGEKLEGTIRDLNYEKEHLASILGSMTDAVVTFDASGKIISSNPHGETFLALWRDLMENAAEGGTAFPPGSGGRKRIPQPLEEVFEAVVAEEKEVTTKLHVGGGVWSVVMAPLYTSGTLRGAVAVLRNVTEEVRLEKLRKDFVANVSHELRTPLSMLQGYSEALLDDIVSTPEERRELAQVIHDESLRMGRLVQDLLDLARLETGVLELHGVETDLAPLLQRVHRKFAALARDRGIAVELDTPGGEGALVLARADEDRLEQVFTNLLDNAIRHTPEGKRIFLRASRIEADNGPSLRIEVEDQGDGIPAEDLPYIFERFYKADKSRKRTSGTGLGLAIVKNLVDAHEGTIHARSRIGHGTTFTVTLPVAPKSVAVEKRR
ncbi:cell wall metabolism sensor histidine kinase WalK [Paenibacillus antri]|uniref:histidine kinase n=1 Tax=Paenibacillus antri TaxID=2582848 RepID=A0A5R9GD74_9BACL|nr:ATP-binding protein [Paenibacillus antri]TLS53059.1 cell wall metabolism sensor histidine kinase WalK [Paenibacillus antri]